jgi:hypothetical protein
MPPFLKQTAHSRIKHVIYLYVVNQFNRTIKQKERYDYMKWIMILGMAFIVFSCAGESKEYRTMEHQLYYSKRVDCTQTKNTNETANITNCPKIRPDEK